MQNQQYQLSLAIVAQEQTQEKYHHAQHEDNSDQAHESVVCEEQVLQEFHIASFVMIGQWCDVYRPLCLRKVTVGHFRFALRQKSIAIFLREPCSKSCSLTTCLAA